MSVETQSPESEVTLAIERLTCASCVRSVETALAKVSGVADASVNLATETAKVRLADGVELSDLVKPVKGAGYGARERVQGAEEHERAARLADLASTRRRLIISVSNTP